MSFLIQVAPTFLTVPDLHPDPFYKHHSSTVEDDACHRGKGPAGVYGAETTDCDSPISLINATFKWIDENLKDQIDFIIWTGDSARHDNDEKIPRTYKQIFQMNKMVVGKFIEVFRNDDDPTDDLIVPIVPTWGNNDIYPHNIFTPGPNEMTKEYLHIWRKFIPEAQRHAFERGGWFSVEVIPQALAVFSLNSIYFFDNNAAVDGCADPSEPGYEQFEWLRIQLEIIRERGMKAILMGHVPPARTDSKMSWDETCWQKYTLWMHQYRDIVVTSLFGHMNIDHFILQDLKEVNDKDLQRPNSQQGRSALDDELTIQSASDYLSELRVGWSKLPTPKKRKSGNGKSIATFPESSVNKKGKEKNAKKSFYKKIGGKWGERYSLALVSPSIIPNYFPSLRVFEYNITELEKSTVSLEQATERVLPLLTEPNITSETKGLHLAWLRANDGKKRPSKKGRNAPKNSSKKHKFNEPRGPSKSSPPGPAYSPQPLTLLGYTQYFANLTHINNDQIPKEDDEPSALGWKDGKHPNKPPKNSEPHPREFKFEVEYNTRNKSDIFGLKDLTVRNYIELASRIGRFKPKKRDLFEGFEGFPFEDEDTSPVSSSKKNKKKKKRKHGHKHKITSKVWYAFVRRAFVGAKDDNDLHNDFGEPIIDSTHLDNPRAKTQPMLGNIEL